MQKKKKINRRKIPDKLREYLELKLSMLKLPMLKEESQ